MSITSDLNNPVRLENWSLTQSGDAYTAPELKFPCLQGQVFGHPNFSEGKQIRTSGILKSEGRFVKTHNTTYILGEVDPTYQKWCDDRNMPIDQDWPVKLRRRN